MSINKPATTTLSPDDNATSQCESATVMTTQSQQNFRGTCTAKFMKDGNEVAPAFDGSDFNIIYGSSFPKTIKNIHISHMDGNVDKTIFFDFDIIPARGDGTYPIPLTSINARFVYQTYSFQVDEGELIINVDNGNCSGTFNLTVTGNPTGNEVVTLNIEEGKFDIKAI